VRPLGAGRAVGGGVLVRRHIHRSNDLDVYEGWCPRRACTVAVKVPRPDRLHDRAVRDALLAEGELLRRLAHPNIVRAYDVHDGARPAVVLEAIGGETLGDLVGRLRRRLSGAEIAHLGLHLAAALHYLHGHDVVHRDVKPSNVVAEAGRAKLLDLSIAGPPGRERAGRGTWSNMAPEQARGEHAGPAADVFGLGTVLWEAAAGFGPFDDHDEDLPTACHRAEPVRRHRRLAQPLAAVIDGCLEPAPEDRPTLAEIRRVLEGAAGVPPR
jgi:serine/threonine protein kinase